MERVARRASAAVVGRLTTTRQSAPERTYSGPGFVGGCRGIPHGLGATRDNHLPLRLRW